jgi:uncharacterized C2H2 Zn-finger protein
VVEKAFALKSAIPTLATNGKVVIYSTLDPNVTMILILKDFEWENRKKEEVWRCARCKTYVFPTDKSKAKDGMKYHQICSFLKAKEAPDELDSRAGTATGT